MKKFLRVMLASVFVFFAGCDNVSVSKSGLSVVDVRMALSKDGPAVTDRKFKKDERIFVSFTVKGIKQADDDQIWIQQDLAINGPDGKPVFSKENLLDMHSKAVKGANEGTFHNDLVLPDDAPVGAYEAVIKIRDKNSGGTSDTTQKFMVVE